MPTPKYYLLDENKNLIEGFDKEGFLGLLEQAIEQGTLENIDEDSAVASKLRSALNGSTHHIEFLTQAQFNQLEADHELVVNTYYFITDDQSIDDLQEHLDEKIEELENDLVDGSIVVDKATNARNAEYAENAQEAETAEKATTTNFTHSNLRTKDLTESSDFLIFSSGYYHFYYEPNASETIDLGVINLHEGNIKKSTIAITEYSGWFVPTFYTFEFKVVPYGVNYQVTMLICKKEETNDGAYPSGNWTNIESVGTLRYKLIK